MRRRHKTPTAQEKRSTEETTNRGALDKTPPPQNTSRDLLLRLPRKDSLHNSSSKSLSSFTNNKEHLLHCGQASEHGPTTKKVHVADCSLCSTLSATLAGRGNNCSQAAPCFKTLPLHHIQRFIGLPQLSPIRKKVHSHLLTQSWMVIQDGVCVEVSGA